jgi:hypothetical protein
MIKNEPYFYDETECTVRDSIEWIPAKQINIIRDPFNYNFIKLIFDLTLETEIGKKGEAAIFIDEEEKPRAIIEYNTPFETPRHIEIDTYNIQYGKHTITLCLKGTITNRSFKISVLRIYTIYEFTMTALMVM